MPTDKRPLKVFLCHAHADRDAVRTLYTRLTNDGVDAWLDKEKLLGGQNWRMEIRTAVEEADVVVVCHSKEFKKEGFRQREVRWALDAAMEKPEGTIFIIPARLEECEVIKSLSDWHWVDLFEENGYEMLMRALRARADRIGVLVKSISTKRHPKLSPTNPGNAIPPWEIREKQQNLGSRTSYTQDASFQSSRKPNGKLRTEYVVAIIGAVATIVAGFLGSPLIKKWFSSASVPTATITFSPNASETVADQEALIATAVVLVTQTLNPTLITTEVYTPTALPTEITDAQEVSMRLVSAGEFFMSNSENPVQDAFLDDFYIDTYEVTNTLYQDCVSTGFCDYPSETKLGDLLYYGNDDYDLYPIIWVSRRNAEKFCSWRDARLPTRNEWEKSARGVDQRMYPWGESVNFPQFANVKGDTDGFLFTAPVGSFPLGASPYGVFDLIGNVAEMVSDTSSSSRTVTKGGAWNTYRTFTSYDTGIVTSADSSVGFRCAKDAP